MGKFSEIYPEYEEVLHGDTIYYYVTMAVGGRDEDGEFLLVLDGPAEGERCYL